MTVSSSAARAQRRQRGRRVGWAGSWLALVLGAAALVTGALVQLTPESREPVALPTDQALVVPGRPPLSGPLVVYGTPPGGGRPTLGELGCEVTEGGGPLSTAQARGEARVVVAGRGLVPLVVFPGREGYAVACTGAAAVEAAPLYVLPGASSRTLVPLAGFSAAALLVPLGGVGVLMLRASRD